MTPEQLKPYIDEAYKLIQKQFLGKGKKFIIHLMNAYLPMDGMRFNFVDDSNKKCCITNKKGYNHEKYTKFKFKSILGDMRIGLLEGEEQEKALKKRNNRIKDYMDFWKAKAGEDVMHTRLLYHDSEKSDTYISKPALIALQMFAMNNMWDNEISRIFSRKRYEKHPRISKKEADVLSMKESGYKLSEGNEGVFSQLRDKFKDEK